MAHLNHPPFTSPILYPDSQTLPATLSQISPITSAAHPLITSLSCALLHPADPSCLRTYVTYWIRVFPKLARFFGIFYAVLSLPRYKSFYNSPLTSLDKLGRRVLTTSAFMAGSIGSSWGAICLFQQFLPRTVLPTQRYFLGGFLGGLWGYLERENSGNFSYSARMSLDSLWKVGVKRGWWGSFKGGDVWLFVVSLAMVNCIYTMDDNSIKGVSRTIIAGLRGESAAVLRIDKEGDEKEL